MSELAQRFSIEPGALLCLAREILARYGPTPGTYIPTPEGFTAHLSHNIITCGAA
ncbi:MAG: hypothetical protein AB1384_09120 [Actinomycetota bacterium]